MSVHTRGPTMAKLETLMEIEGFETIEVMLEACIHESVTPAICMSVGCDNTGEMEPDQDEGYCEECHANSMKSALVLMGFV